MYILYINTDFGLSIHHFNNVNECLNFVNKSHIKAYKYKPISEQLPMQFYFAFYWNESKKDADVDINIAKEIKKDEFRGIRHSIMEKLDILFMKSLEQGDDELKAKIVNAKQKMRDITSEEMPNTWQELLYFYPQTFTDVINLIQD
jgi:hypothetical protein